MIVCFLLSDWRCAKSLPTHAPHLTDHDWSGAGRRERRSGCGFGMVLCCVGDVGVVGLTCEY